METGKIYTPYIQLHDCPLFAIGSGTSIKRSGFKLVYGPKPPLLLKNMS